MWRRVWADFITNEQTQTNTTRPTVPSLLLRWRCVDGSSLCRRQVEVAAVPAVWEAETDRIYHKLADSDKQKQRTRAEGHSEVRTRSKLHRVQPRCPHERDR